MTAQRAVRHVVEELEIAVELSRHVDLVQRELVGRAERRALWLLLEAGAADDLVGRAAVELAAAPEVLVLRALPALELELVVAVDRTQRKVEPVESRLLLLLALVVRVGRAGEGVGTLEGGRSPGNQGQNRDRLHDGGVGLPVELF